MDTTIRELTDVEIKQVSGGDEPVTPGVGIGTANFAGGNVYPAVLNGYFTALEQGAASHFGKNTAAAVQEL